MDPNQAPVHKPLQMANGGPWFTAQHVEEITWGRTATVTLSVQNVGPDHITQISVMHLQNQKKVTFVSIVVAKTTLQESAPTDLTTTERNQGQHLRTSRVKEQSTSGNKNHVPNQNKDPHHQARFDERHNRQYLPNYNNFQPSPLGSIPGLDLSATLIELANIQSRYLEMMAARQRSQQEAFHEVDESKKR